MKQSLFLVCTHCTWFWIIPSTKFSSLNLKRSHLLSFPCTFFPIRALTITCHSPALSVFLSYLSPHSCSSFTSPCPPSPSLTLLINSDLLHSLLLFCPFTNLLILNQLLPHLIFNSLCYIVKWRGCFPFDCTVHVYCMYM